MMVRLDRYLEKYPMPSTLSRFPPRTRGHEWGNFKSAEMVSVCMLPSLLLKSIPPKVDLIYREQADGTGDELLTDMWDAERYQCWRRYR